MLSYYRIKTLQNPDITADDVPRVSTVVSVGASASQRCPPDTRTLLGGEHLYIQSEIRSPTEWLTIVSRLLVESRALKKNFKFFIPYNPHRSKRLPVL